MPSRFKPADFALESNNLDFQAPTRSACLTRNRRRASLKNSEQKGTKPTKEIHHEVSPQHIVRAEMGERRQQSRRLFRSFVFGRWLQ